jgi:hypothetical protein
MTLDNGLSSPSDSGNLATMVVDRPAVGYNLHSTFPTLSRAPITEALIDFQSVCVARILQLRPANLEFQCGKEILRDLMDT